MSGYDDDDWVGQPPEGRYTADRADPQYWQKFWPYAGVGLSIVIMVLLIVVLTR